MNVVERLLCVVSYLKSIKNLSSKNNKSWNNELEEMSNRVSLGEGIPPTIRALVDEDYVNEDRTDIEKWRHCGENILYALPYSDAQKEIMIKLSENFGVVVEGPPGTGKSHSAANLIGHLIAHGKRVLVTSERDKPLRSILDKVPETIRPLCLCISENDGQTLSRADNSIRQIIDNLNLDMDKLSKEIKSLEGELETCRNRQKALNNNLKKFLCIGNREIKYCGRTYKLSGVESWLKENEDSYSWIEDDISSTQKPPLSDAKFSRLIYLISNISKEDLIQFHEMGGFLYNIPPCNELIEKMRRVMELKKNYIKYKRAVKDWCISYNINYDYDDIIKRIEDAENFLQDIQGTWLHSVLECTRKGETAKLVLQQTILKCNYYIKKIGSIKKEISGHNVEIPKDMDISFLEENFNLVYKQFEEKGKINRFFRLFHGPCESILDKSSVDGKTIETKEQAKIAKLYIEQCTIEDNLINLWNNSMKEYGAEEISNVSLNAITNLEDYINKIDMIINWDVKVRDKIVASMRKVVFLSKIDWYNVETYSNLKYGILSIKYISEYENLKSYTTSIGKLISNTNGFEEVVQALNKNDILSLRQSYKKLERLKEIGSSIIELEYLMEKINKDCPKLGQALINEEDKLNMLVKYRNFSVAWSWKQMNSLLKDNLEKFKLEDIEKEIEKEKDRENHLMGSLVEKGAWYNLISNIEEGQKRSICAWREAIKRIGKGNSKANLEYINLAKKEMASFKDVIPVWLMPINKVIENFSLSEKAFDVVIMDEGSECNIFAISALFRAKKAVILGDDKETNLETLGVNKNQIRTLIKKHLKGVPHSEWFDMGTSIYSTALRIFHNKVTLKECFRSLPQIIGFSNELCYSNEIIPAANFKLNEIPGSPIQTVRVDGQRDKTKPINLKEAESIVNKIVECCSDSKYNGMTMGVISLLGDAQGAVIEGMLKERLKEREIIDRKLTCGNPSSFQGEERDVIFLSMVISNDVKFTALTREADIRRFNLAASRARKQMWLFYSIDPESINSECVRGKLLKYCMNFNKKNSKKVSGKDIYRIA